MRNRKRGRRLAYAHIIEALDPKKRYGLDGLMRFAKENGFMVPAEDDPSDEHGNCILSAEQIRERYRSTFYRYMKRLDPIKGAVICDGTSEEMGWYGCYWQVVLLTSSNAEKTERRWLLKELELDEVAREQSC